MESLGKNIQKFTRFLKEKGIYALYFREVKGNKNEISTINSSKFKGDIKKFLKHYSSTAPWSIIDKSLLWDETQNGFDFWNSIDKEWKIYLNRW